MLIAPTIFTGLVIASWALRPLSRRDVSVSSPACIRAHTIAYWIATRLLAQN